MDKEKAIQILKRCEAESYCSHYKRHHCCIGCGQREALDLAIEALKGDLHCPKCGTIVRDGRQYHDLVYRREMTLEEWQELDREIRGDAESATTTDCISRADTIKAMCRECQMTKSWGLCEKDCTEVAIVRGMPPVNQKQTTGKLESTENATSEDEESTMGQPKSKLDCISRQQAIEALGEQPEIAHDTDEERAERSTWAEHYRAILSLPPVEPERPKGEWIDTDSHELFKTEECSVCGHESIERGNFCRYCGADMRGDDSE